MFSTNVTGLINMTQAILPLFKAHDPPRGDIINIGSIAGREPYQGGSIYCATKAAVRSFTDAMRRELIATRIRVIEIDPGQVETEFSVVRFGGDREKANKVYEGVEPLTPEDIAEIVVFAAGRRENVVLADSLVFPNHQVCASLDAGTWNAGLMVYRLRLRLCIGKLLVSRLLFGGEGVGGYVVVCVCVNRGFDVFFSYRLVSELTSAHRLGTSGSFVKTCISQSNFSNHLAFFIIQSARV
jgi:hypothetical protein